MPPEQYVSWRDRLHARLEDMIEAPWENAEAWRLATRLGKCRDELFTFVDHKGVPFENNHAERESRPAAIHRKKNYSNRRAVGADCQAVLM